jgi:hypothetical protein
VKPHYRAKRLFRNGRKFEANKMKKQLSDEQLDKLMRKLANDAAADEATITEIANSPTVWWAVQRNIKSQQETMLSPWPPVGKVLRWLMVGVPVAAVLLLSFFIFRPLETRNNFATALPGPMSRSVVDSPSEEVRSAPPSARPEAVEKSVEKSAKVTKHQIVTAKTSREPRLKILKPEATTTASAKKSAEIKTEFIALSYARDPESGQIVRVKVPSSMMVSLGLVVSVEKPSDLVDAEVLVGDDGLTRAIRFIR